MAHSLLFLVLVLYSMTPTISLMKPLVKGMVLSRSYWRSLSSSKVAAAPTHVGKERKAEVAKLRKTGAFKTELPDIFIASTHHRRALRKLKEVKQDSTIKNQRDRQRRFCATSLDTLMKGLTMPITECLNAYKQTFRRLHPFEATVADLVVKSRIKRGKPDLRDIMDNLKSLRASTSVLAKEYASKAAKAPSAIEAKDALEEGQLKLAELYNTTITPHANCLEDLVDLQKDLRRIPVLELDTLTLVLVGTPNVGKSSIVRKMSSGQPEVNNYPFTTRSVTIGHIVDEKQNLRFQVMDTPGLLDRPVEDRNEMEKLTFASLAHLPTAVMFVIDPTGLAGEQSNLQAQLRVRKMLRERFPRRPWIDVVSKADLKDDISEEVIRQLPEGHWWISVTEDIQTEELFKQVQTLLSKDLRQMLIAIKRDNAEAANEGEKDEEKEA